MSEPTKACNLTEEETKALIKMHAVGMDKNDIEFRIERMNYLNKRLKAFKEVEVVFEKEIISQKDGW